VATSLAVSIEAAVRHVAYLGGRATYYLVRDDEFVVVPDYASTHPVYWHEAGAKVTFSNYLHLVAEVTGAERNEPYIDLMRRARELGANRTIYWPGIETPFLGVNPVLVHHLARVRAGQALRHERFYPFPDTQLIGDVDRAYDAFREQFLSHTQLLTSLSRDVGISLTGGRDSQATLKAALPHVRRSRVRTWTYLSPQPTNAMRQDVRAARELAQSRRLRHDVVLLHAAVRPEVAEAFDYAYKRTFRYTAQFQAVPRAYANDLPSSILELQSMVAECGTGFYKERREPFTLDKVVRLYQDSPFGGEPLVRSALERYLDYSGLMTDDLAPLDWHDVLYQESRIGRWGSLRIQEVELAHRIHLPFNARGIVEALSGPKFADRIGKQALVRLAAELG
jgi:asparagine synthase (glutamine-hydrolysing)